MIWIYILNYWLRYRRFLSRPYFKHYELQYPNRSSIIFNFKTMAYFNQLYFMFYYGNAMWDNTPNLLNIRKIHQHPTEYHLFIYSLQTNDLINT